MRLRETYVSVTWVLRILIYFDGHLQVRLTNYCSIEKIYMLLVIWSSVPHKIPHHRDFFEKYLLVVIGSSVPHKIPYPRNFYEKLFHRKKYINRLFAFWRPLTIPRDVWKLPISICTRDRSYPIVNLLRFSAKVIMSFTTIPLISKFSSSSCGSFCFWKTAPKNCLFLSFSFYLH